MRAPVRRRLDEILDRRVAGAAEIVAAARSRRDEAARAARLARDRVDGVAARRLAAFRAPPPAPLGSRGLATATSRARIVVLDREAGVAQSQVEAAASASETARRDLLRALVRRRALRRILAAGPGAGRR